MSIFLKYLAEIFNNSVFCTVCVFINSYRMERLHELNFQTLLNKPMNHRKQLTLPKVFALLLLRNHRLVNVQTIQLSAMGMSQSQHFTTLFTNLTPCKQRTKLFQYRCYWFNDHGDRIGIEHAMCNNSVQILDFFYFFHFKL